MTTKSGKHANKIAKNALDSAVNKGVAKAVDIRKVAALSAGAAGVIAGAAIAFGSTPAMAVEANTSAPVNTNDPAKEQSVIGKKNESSKYETPNSEVKEQNKKKEPKKEPTEQIKPTEQTVVNAEGANSDVTELDNNAEQKVVGTEGGDAKTYNRSVDNKDVKQNTAENSTPSESGAKKRARRSLDANKQPDDSTVVTDRATTPARAPQSQSNSTIELSQDKKDTLPNMYAWGKSDNVYVENGQNQEVTFKFAKPEDGRTITNIAIFPSDINSITNTSMGFLEYYSAPDAGDPHQSYSGTYNFKVNADGTATLTMTKLYRDGNLNSAEKYAANRCIYVYGKGNDGKEVLLYKTNIVRATTLVPPKNAGSIVLKYDEQLTDEQIRARLKQALDAPTEATGKKSIREQIKTESTSKGVGSRTGANDKFVQTPDDPYKKVVITDKQAYDDSKLTTINTVTSEKGAAVTTYKTGAQTLNTYLISDLGYKSEALALTVARYDTRIEKPIVDDTSNVSEDVKNEIAKKLARINGVSPDKITFDNAGNAVINFDGVESKDAPKIALRDLVLKKIAEADVNIPTGDQATFVYNPIGYSDVEIARIKKSIYDANKSNTELGLTEADYEKQISLEYITGNITASGRANDGISNGMAENAITVKIKTDKAVAEFKSDVKTGKLTKLVNIRKDYTVSWEESNKKIANRESDEGLSWSEDHKTIIYRYDPTKAAVFKSGDVIKLLKATPKDPNVGLRTLTGGESLDSEGSGKPQKSYMHYVLKDDQPTGELTLGIMSGPYWNGDPQIAGTDVDMGNVLAKTDKYKWDDDAQPVEVASKDGKIYRARLFVAPYDMGYYQYLYAFPDGKNANNTPKAINFIFVPQTNHKKSDLQKSIGEHAVTNDGKKTPTDSKYYNASDSKKNAYDNALKEANEALKAAGTTEDAKLTEALKARIDNATIQLDKAREALDGDATNKDGLETSIEANGKAAENQTPASGTQATSQFKNVSDPDFKTADGTTDTERNKAAKAAKTAYDDALAEAKKLKDDANATQKAVDDAKAKLDAARDKLNDFTTNKNELNAAIANNGHVYEYTNDTLNTLTVDQKLEKADPTYKNSSQDEREAYDNALETAVHLAKDPNASQKEVNEAIKKLKEAKEKLDANATDKSKLAAAEKRSFDNPDSSDPSKQSTFYKNALNKKSNGDDQEKRNATTAINNYDDALTNARTILMNDKATQAQVNEAKQKLEDAENTLHEGYKSDGNDLTKAIADNVSGYLMTAYFNAFDQAQKDGANSQAAKDFKAYNDAYQKAKVLSAKLKETDVAKKPTQNEINEAKAALEKARTVIDSYATDTSKISAALLQSLAVKASPAYQNTSADDASEAAKKAKKAYDDALKKLQKAFDAKMPKDKDAQGIEISTDKVPSATGDVTSKNYLDGIQSHAKGHPLNRDVTAILDELNSAKKELDKFATKTDDLIKSINEDATTHPSPAFKNASVHRYLGDDGNADAAKNAAARNAANYYGQALNEAKDLLNDSTATQAQVNAAKKKLDDARKALGEYKTDVKALKDSVDKHGSTEELPSAKEGTVTSDAYRNADDPHFLTTDGKPDTKKNDEAKKAKKYYDKALAKAQDLMKKADPESKTPLDAQPTQKEIDDALKALDDARTEIEKYKTNTDALSAEAEKSQADTATTPTAGQFEDSPEFKNAYDKKDGTNDNADVKAYKEALKKARDLVKSATSTDPNTKNSERPTQKQINDALDALKQAKKAITNGYKTDVDKLKQAKEYAEDVFKKTPEYKNAIAIKNDNNNAKHEQAGKDLGDVTNQTGFEGQIAKIAKQLEYTSKLTQREVDALVKQLKKAQKTIAERYKTNVTPLSNEVDDKDQDGKLVTPKFEESIPYKNALEKAKTETDKDSADSATKKLEDYNKKLKAAQDLIAQVNNPDSNADPDKKPTQSQVDEALKALQEAKNAIKDAFKTKVDALKKETKELKEDGGAKEDKDKFENSTEYKNADAKKGTDGTSDNADVSAYKDALKKANDLLDLFGEDGNPKADIPADKQIPTQKEVDDALKNLKDIKDKILKNYVTSPKDLQDEVDKSKNGDDDTRDGLFENTPEFKNADAKKGEDGKSDNADMAAYKTALETAKKLLDAFDRTTGKVKDQLPQGMTKAPTQKELDDALQKLQEAKSKIEKDYATKKEELKSEAGKDSDFTKTPEYQNAQAKGDDASKQALEDYKKALDEANKVLGDKNATQKQVDDALKKLQDAKSKLSDGYKTNKSDLDTEAGKDSDFTKTPEFQNAAGSPEADAYKQALDEANKVLGDKNATQKQVDEALKKLQDAKQKLADSHKTDKSGLVSEYVTDPDFRKSIPFIIGKAADLAEYQQALNDADSVLKDPNATQDQVNQALRRLRDAKQKLIDAYNRLINSDSGVGDNTGVGVNDSNTTSVNNVVDKGALQAEVDAALGDVSANANGVVADSNLVSEFNAALNYARSVLADANATQGQVDSALARLRAARAALRAGMLAARDSAGMNLKRGDVSGVNTGASSSVFAALAAVFAGLGVAGAASKRRKHSAR
ncbi:peptidase [Gardnerella vaginalis]|uniref:peptidase n=1 Tax=Gardnerella vaginalis TaxID=2702 RepID=UPI001FF2CB6B|nr:peptidase [Gardnerella vaginalis]